MPYRPPPSLPIISITTITASRVYVSEASLIAATETKAATAAAAAAPVVSATTTTNRRDDDDDDHPVANQLPTTAALVSLPVIAYNHSLQHPLCRLTVLRKLPGRRGGRRE